MNLFNDARTLEEVVFQAIGAGSTCWENMSGTGVFQDARAVTIGNDAVARIRRITTWLCPNCWKRWSVEMSCPNCGDNPAIGLYRHPPVDPVTGEVSADDDAILMGELEHNAVPERFRNPNCTAVMDDHGWLDDGSPDGVTVCPPADHA